MPHVGSAKTPSALPKYHWAKDPFDIRDKPYQLVPMPTVAPRVDLRQYASAIEDQGNLGSCTGNAIAGAIELMDRKNNKQLEISRLFIYYQERLLEGTVYYDAGAYIRDGIKACYTYGAPLESLWPYNQSKWATRPTTAAYNDALNRRVTGYAKCFNYSAVKNALAAGTPVIIGFTVYSSFEGAWSNIKHGQAGSGMMPYPNVGSESILGGHAVCLVGYDDNLNGGRFIARNSWGTGWGDNGYFYMPYQVIQNTSMSSDFWTISSVHNP
jgi:C1A family cysteine protease